MDLKKRMDEIFDIFGQKDAIVGLHYDNNRTKNTFEDLRHGANNLNAIIKELKIGRAERIAVLAPHSPYAAACVIHLAYIGVTAVLLDASLPISELRRLIDYSDISGLIVANLWLNLHLLPRRFFNKIMRYSNPELLAQPLCHNCYLYRIAFLIFHHTAKCLYHCCNFPDRCRFCRIAIFDFLNPEITVNKRSLDFPCQIVCK